MIEIKIPHRGRSSDEIAQILYEGFNYGGLLRPPEKAGESVLWFSNDEDGQEFLNALPNDIRDFNK